MQALWTLLGIALFGYLFYMLVTGARRRGERSFVPVHKVGKHGPERDLGGNINPSQHGNEVDLWPDRTGARTRRELGARHAVDMTFAGDRPERKQGGVAALAARPEPGAAHAGPHEHGPGTNPRADLAPEDHLGEDRPAARTHAPDAQPTQWHPDSHGVPGGHDREGHHRSASGPERITSTSDPYAHAPVPGPNHILPQGGDELPPGTRP